ncbi:DUF6494 family protein [Methylomarinum sp. Ch1-1]|uniref:DUF6494 family protein n=1 Tax=Methylomarinum roseum TaxID=3067653 RepID=A0AAU7NYR7_9GAMM|nr:DUF6494 family protein [Methylomarinum sp. Ch1-1]MDP4521685.1 DUF6494 family protein [Methylomarinum sp. Ch1-1]
MNEDILNLEVRKYLKKVGLTSQREIEHAILKAIENGNLQGSETLPVKMTLELPDVDLKLTIEGDLAMD